MSWRVRCAPFSATWPTLRGEVDSALRTDICPWHACGEIFDYGVVLRSVVGGEVGAERPSQLVLAHEQIVQLGSAC